LSKADDRIDIFRTWIGPPLPRLSERIFLVPSATADNFDAALCMLDDGFRCIRPVIEEAVQKYSETVDIDIPVHQWRKIIGAWESLLGNLESDLKSQDPYDYPPYSMGRWVTLQLSDTHLSRADALQQFRCFVREVIEYLERHLDTSDHITLTSL
jgi:hypothetical protein